jgi:hypothetical protein
MTAVRTSVVGLVPMLIGCMGLAALFYLELSAPQEMI